MDNPRKPAKTRRHSLVGGSCDVGTIAALGRSIAASPYVLVGYFNRLEILREKKRIVTSYKTGHRAMITTSSMIQNSKALSIQASGLFA